MASPPAVATISPATVGDDPPQDDTSNLNAAIALAASAAASGAATCAASDGLYLPGTHPGDPPPADGPNACQGIVSMRPGVYYLRPVSVHEINAVVFQSNVRLEIDAAATLRQLPNSTGRATSGLALFNLGVGSALANVTLIGVGSSAGSSDTVKPPTNFAAPAGFPGWDIQEYFTIDLGSGSGANVNTAGIIVESVQNFLVANVFSRQLNPDPTDSQTDPTNSQRAVLGLRNAADPPPSQVPDPQNGTVSNWYNIDSPAGYGPNQVNGGDNLTLTNIFSDGGTALRLETDASGDEGFTGQLSDVTATYIGAENCNRAVSFVPHSQTNDDIDVAHVWAQDCYQGVVESISSSEDGAFNDTVISDVTVIGGSGSPNDDGSAGCVQVRTSGNQGAWRCGTSAQAFAYEKASGATESWRVEYVEGTYQCSGTFTAANDKIVQTANPSGGPPTTTVLPTCAATGAEEGATTSVAAAAPAVSAGSGACGMRLTASYALTADIGPCPHGGLVVDADNVTVDLNSFRIFGGTKRDDAIGIDISGHSGVTVRNGTISHFGVGVAVNGGRANVVKGVTATHNVGTGKSHVGDGIVLFQTTDNVIRNNRVSFNGPFAGIAIVGDRSSGNVIEANVVSDNNVRRTDGRYENDGIRLEPGTHHNTIARNTVSGNGLEGIAVFFESHDNTVVRNTVHGNGFHNHRVNRPGDGIHVFPAADGSRIQNNVITGSAADGVIVESTGNGVRLNTSTGNGAGRRTADHPGPFFDVADTNRSCAFNRWAANLFGTSNPACIR